MCVRERERGAGGGGGRGRERERLGEGEGEMEIYTDRLRERERERERERQTDRQTDRQRQRERGGGGRIITMTADRAKRICLPESSLQWQRSRLWNTSSQRQTTESLISLLSTLVKRPGAHDRLSLERKDRRNCPLSQPRLLARTLGHESPPLPLQTLSRSGRR